MVVVQEPYQNEIQGMLSSYQVYNKPKLAYTVAMPLLETRERLEGWESEREPRETLERH